MDLKDKETIFLNNRKNANSLIEILVLLEDDEVQTVASAVESLDRIFNQLLIRKAMFLPVDPAQLEEPNADDKYKLWLRERYSDLTSRLLTLLSHSDKSIQELSLVTLMKLVQGESKTPLKPVPATHLTFPTAFFTRIITEVASSDDSMTGVCGAMKDYLVYDDVRFFAMKSLNSILKTAPAEMAQEASTNIIALLENLSMPTIKKKGKKEALLQKLMGSGEEKQSKKSKKKKGKKGKKKQKGKATVEKEPRKEKQEEEEEVEEMPDRKEEGEADGEEEVLTNFLGQTPNTESRTKMTQLSEHRKLYTRVWLELLKKKLSSGHFRQVLILLSDKVMPHMHNPLLLADFLTQAYGLGGALSLLSLSGLFRLMHKHNLHYPDYYEKLYALLTPSVLHEKFKARFFYLLDLSLQSTHLPNYLVAAFAKRLSRVSLTAPVQCLPLLTEMVLSLVRRYPTCRPLLHDAAQRATLSEDPYDFEERDPAKCKAMESSLWELKIVQDHYWPDISAKVTQLGDHLSPHDVDVAPLLEITPQELGQGERKRKMKDVPLTYLPPKAFCRNNREDTTSLCWGWS